MLAEFLSDKKKTLVTAVGVIGSVATIYTTVVFVDDRFVHAADFAVQMEQQQKVLKDYRVQQLEDKIFELEFKEQSGVDTPLDRALKERYKQQLNRLNSGR